MKKINIGIIGVGGYAKTHLESIHNCEERGLCVLKAAVIRNPDKANYREIETELKNRGINIYRSYDEMFSKESGKIDLIAIPGGIDQHAEQSIKALEYGFHVLCEKPVAGTAGEAYTMQKVRRKADRILAIGYQHIFSPVIQKIKQIRIKKALGKLISAKAYTIWPRTRKYYARNSWAGKLEINGKKIYDSPMQNAMAHFINNMLYVAGKEEHEAAIPVEVYAENYRAKEITCADTQCLRINTAEGVEIFFVGTHAAKIGAGVFTDYIFERGKILWRIKTKSTSTGVLEATVYEKSAAGDYKIIDCLTNQGMDIKNQVFINTIQAVQQNKPPLCTIDNSWQHTLCVNKAFESSQGVIPISRQYLEKLELDSDYTIIIKNINTTIHTMYEQGKTFFESGCPWAKQSKTILCH